MKLSQRVKVRLTAEDKKIFRREIAKATPKELLQVSFELDLLKERFTAADNKFFRSHIGARAMKLLKNVAKNFSWDDE